LDFNVFAKKSSRVLRVLLANSGKDWKERQLAEEAKTSSCTVHYVFKKLIEMKLAARNKQNRFILTDPSKLLRIWASHHHYDLANEFLGYFALEREIDMFIGKLADIELEYSLSGLVAAWLVAPSVQTNDFHLYVPSEDIATKIAERIELNPRPRGGNVRFVLPYDEGVFYGTRIVRGVRVVSNIQLFLDLYNVLPRGRKAASQILDLVLKEWHEEREK